MAGKADLSRIGKEIDRQNALLRKLASKYPPRHPHRGKLALTIRKLERVRGIVSNSCSQAPLLRWKGPDPNTVPPGGAQRHRARAR
jgi:hypothetical protein